MKKSLVALAFVLIGSFAMAQQTATARPMDHKHKMREHRAQMQKELNLTPEQMRKMDEMELRHRSEMDRNRDDKKQMMEDRRAQRDAEIKQILTPEQYAKWQERKQTMKQNHDKKRSGHGQHRQEARPAESRRAM